jgi:hypothetical protein
MPKTNRDFPSTLNFGSTVEMKQLLTAIGYFQNGKREYASPARNMIKQGVDAWLSRLTPREREEFNKILENVKIEVAE